ncbi:MAG TPA: FliH/SctL family protein [Sphingomonas sp.]|nr:FliH/SctL family protein [Sphingomonas sp.]
MTFHNVQRFAFDRVFTAHPPGSAPASADLMAEIANLRSEIAALQAEHGAQLALARAQGFEAGLAQARAERDTALLSAVDALQAGLETIDERFDEVAQRVTGEAAEIALAAADMIAGRALETAPADAIDAAIARVLGQVARGTELEVRVHPELAEAVEARITERQSKDRRRLFLTVFPDATIAMGDAMIGWDQGGLAVDASARRDAVHAELETLLPH